MKVLIVEDEPVIAQRIVRQMTEILQDHNPNIVWQEDLDDALAYIHEHSIDLLILDLNLHGNDGFEILKTLVAESFQTIIVSAYRDKAIDAFAFGVVDFVAKPFTFERLSQAVSRYLNQQEAGNSALKYLAIKKAQGISLIELSKLSYIQADGHYSKLFLVDDYESVLHDKSIDKLANLLPTTFVRIHRSYIVKLSEIDRVHVAGGGSYQLDLKSGIQLPIARGRYQSLKQRLI